MASILKVDGELIVNEHGSPIVLRGAGLGGWMKYELFWRSPAAFNSVELS